MLTPVLDALYEKKLDRCTPRRPRSGYVERSWSAIRSSWRATRFAPSAKAGRASNLTVSVHAAGSARWHAAPASGNAWRGLGVTMSGRSAHAASLRVCTRIGWLLPPELYGMRVRRRAPARMRRAKRPAPRAVNCRSGRARRAGRRGFSDFVPALIIRGRLDHAAPRKQDILPLRVGRCR